MYHIKEPREMKVDADLLEEIETQTLKVRLISCSLKNPKKSYQNLETDYNEKLNNFRNKTIQTEENQRYKTQIYYGRKKR